MSRRQPASPSQTVLELYDLLADWQALARGPEVLLRRLGYQQIKVNGRGYWLPPEMDVEAARKEIAERFP